MAVHGEKEAVVFLFPFRTNQPKKGKHKMAKEEARCLPPPLFFYCLAQLAQRGFPSRIKYCVLRRFWHWEQTKQNEW